MKIICKQNNAKQLDLKEVVIITSSAFEFDIEVDKEYLVMGIALYKETSCLYYLIDDKYGLPNWYPYMLFDVLDNTMNPDWFFWNVNKGDVRALWGFDELCNNADFYDQLAEREPQAMEVYLKRKEELGQ